MIGAPKYSQPEIERRWLVEHTDFGALARSKPFRHIEDRYIVGTRLRLRKIEHPDGVVTFKLGKKYGARCEGIEHVVSMYLDEQEYNVLAALATNVTRKRRYAVAGGSIDEYIYPNTGPLIFEVEFASVAEARAYTAPSFVGLEVTGNSTYSGFTIASEA
jgi:CYTH domain-containing protein